MNKIRINYTDGKHKTFKSSIHTAESLRKEIEQAVEEGRTYLLISGIEIFPFQVEDIKDV